MEERFSHEGEFRDGALGGVRVYIPEGTEVDRYERDGRIITLILKPLASADAPNPHK